MSDQQPKISCTPAQLTATWNAVIAALADLPDLYLVSVEIGRYSDACAATIHCESKDFTRILDRFALDRHRAEAITSRTVQCMDTWNGRYPAVRMNVYCANTDELREQFGFAAVSS